MPLFWPNYKGIVTAHNTLILLWYVQFKHTSMTDLTFDKLPEAVAQLYNKLSNIERLLQTQSLSPLPEADKLLTVQEAAEFLNLSVPTVYGYVQRQEVPVCKRSKRLYFSKQQLTEWIKGGRKKTNSEIAEEAEKDFLLKKKGGNR